MNFVQNPLKKKSSHMRKSVSTDSLPDFVTAYQNLSISQASLKSIPCIIKSISDYKLDKSFDEDDLNKNIGICLASPPDLKCDDEETEEIHNTTLEIRVTQRRRRENNNDLKYVS